jgi:hypothetical protein
LTLAPIDAQHRPPSLAAEQKGAMQEAQAHLDAAKAELRAFLCTDEAVSRLDVGKTYPGYTLAELYTRKREYIDWVCGLTEPNGRLAAVQEWALDARARGSEVERARDALARLTTEAAVAVANATKRLRMTTARGQLAELPAELLAHVARYLPDLRSYARLGASSPAVRAGLQPSRGACIAALGFAHAPAPGQRPSSTHNAALARARRMLGVPDAVRTTTLPELERVAALVEAGAVRELRQLVRELAEALRVFGNKRTAWRAACTASEFTELPIERVTNAKQTLDAARASVGAAIAALRGHIGELRLGTACPSARFQNEHDLREWRSFCGTM